ncbi:hypothetical protein FNV43_RR06627 [Rhamnella rubrinervis]|uniref:Uncharacterized protein n=1 Tax=Rhamnella rubrinervis TaxID=2594499 RepID=A0A8K0HDD0_9ROSA|nr:hypothetical protein FNV43_RR06627 [Rhamnella rubrinervis]
MPLLRRPPKSLAGTGNHWIGRKFSGFLAPLFAGPAEKELQASKSLVLSSKLENIRSLEQSCSVLDPWVMLWKILKGLQITSLDDDDEEEVVEIVIYEDGDEEASDSMAWLDLVNLPSGRTCLSDISGEPLHFVLQVYAPLDKECAFHIKCMLPLVNSI